ncbi:DoxX family protein [Cellulomonas palmilytica]|uniref:DoxX family protein n=1 Tax=Cellulomonas palmilytica TaxID=2608402 RepID=UPI001F4558EC|nr:DoxX family protein [Cellulomonas palmilytica]UJP40464.1 DoxX family protein [Cellulomonas palmilytica]
MSTVLWILQILLAVAFVATGLLKATQPRERLESFQPWVEEFPTRTIRLIGVAELLAALGLVLPAATGILPVLTPLAATGLVVVMLLAARVHARRGERQAIVVNAVLLVLAAVVAWGRFGPYAL